MFRTLTVVLAAALLAAPAPALAQEQVRIGFIATMSGPAGGLGADLRDGFLLGVKHKDGKLGGLETEIVMGDDQLKPDVGRQVATKMIESDKADIITGIVFSNVMMAIQKPVLDSGTFLISANAGPSAMAGKLCHRNFFNVAWQNDNTHEAMGRYVHQQGFENVYLMAPNYPAGKDALAGFKRFYKRGVAGEVYTKLGQPDYAAELAELRAAKPDAVFVFYPGGMAVNFVKQYAQAGLKEEIPLFGPSFLLDQTVLKAQGDAALGLYNTAFWSQQLRNESNAKFVADFISDYGRLPSPYAAQAYDAAQLIDAALRETGSVKVKDSFRAALEEANFPSVRGPFRFNSNHFPVQNFYLRQVVKDDDGNLVNSLEGIVFSSHSDAYAKDCVMR